MAGYLYNLATDKAKGFIPSILKAFLFILSIVYGLFIRAMSFFQQLFACRLNCKIISVGNITLGGTGKTTIVEYVVRELRARGRKVAIVSRGYKRVSDERETEVGVKGPENRNRCQGVNEMGDEPYMLQKKLKDIPVVVDADRVRGIKKAIRDFGVDTVVLDDAFQQWRIKKDLEIVAVDCTNPFGNKHMLPRGILREPLSSLRRADVFMLTKANLCSGITAVRGALKNINPSAAIFESWHQPADFSMLNAPGQEFPADSLKGKNIGAFCGIGDPVSFENTLKNLGGHIGISLRFPDHHNYTGLDLGNIIKSCRDSDIDTIVTTEKDAVRVLGILPDKTSCKFLVLRIELKLKDEQGFRDRLLKLYPL